MEAKLLGLFVEDVSLLRFADAPYAREILFPSAAEVPLTRTSMESSLRAQSEWVRETVAAVAQRAQVSWSFRTVRGRVTEEVLAAAGEVDLLAIGKVGWSLGTQARLGSTALKVATSSVPVLLLSGRAVPSQFHFVTYFDRTPAANRALLAAAQLAEVCKRSLTILIAATDQKSIEHMRQDLEAILQGRHIEVRYRQIDPQDEMSVRRAMKGEQAGILVLKGQETIRKLETLESLLRENDIALLLLDDR
jgi:nucleotide-binding universal stress UspA family protein